MIRYEDFEGLTLQVKKDLETYSAGSEEHSRALDSYVKLERLRIDQQKADVEQDCREAQLKAQKERDIIDLVAKHSINIVEFLISCGFSWKLAKFILRFEEEGTVRSFGGRQGLTKIFSKFLTFK